MSVKQFELVIKKSRFVAFALQLQSVLEFNQFLEQLTKQHKKATHICWGLRLLENGVEVSKFSDDGEPSGTAGKPILSVLEKKKLQNTAVFVVRYFGGIKLGGGGLVRAYSKAASGVLS